MKAKYLFGMLLSGAMLAACTADDDLNAGKLAQQTPSAPVFTVSFDNDGELQNRATLNTDLWQLGFDEKDKMSLYHGIATTAYETLTGWQNAVYYGDGEGADVTMSFKTAAMVQPGLAVMIYPADTEFGEGKYDENNLGAGAPVISIDDVQTEKTVENTPYMSEILTIAIPTTGKEDNQAGYDKNYDITLKRAASTLSLTLNITKKPELPAGVAALAVNRVALTDLATVEDEEGPFTTSIPVKGLNQQPAAYVNTNNSKVHTSWTYVSELDTDNAKGVPSLLTKDVKNNVATFTLLPMGEELTTEKGQVTVQTNYGKVDFTDASGNKIWKGTKETTAATANEKAQRSSVETTVTAGINNMAAFIWHKATKGTFCYDGNEGETRTENVGGHINCTLDADLSTLDMDQLHILNEQHLVDAIAVYNKLCPEAEVTFLLDGDEDGVFEMTNETWAVVEAQLKKEESNLKFAPCTDKGEECDVIVLNNKKSTAEVPELQFAGEEGVELDLAGGNWTYTSKTAGSSAKNIDGVTEIHVTEGVHLTPVNFVAIKGAKADDATDLTVVIDEGAFMDVTGNVRLQLDVNNYGTINIGEGAFLRADQDVRDNGTKKTLTNCSQNQNTAGSITGLNRTCGVINNSGTLGVVNEATQKFGAVNNYGIIDIKTKNATTMITTNAKDDASFATGYTNENQIGEIILDVIGVTGNDKVSIDGEKGFVKYTINKNTPTYADFGGDECFANYIILGPNCENLLYANDGKSQPTLTNLPDGIDYLDVQSKLVNFKTTITGGYTLKGLIVRKSCQFDIVANSTLDVEDGAFYLDGIVNIIGTLKGNNTTSCYYGKTSVDNFTGNGTHE